MTAMGRKLPLGTNWISYSEAIIHYGSPFLFSFLAMSGRTG
jgi:hypothetical protein